MNLKESLEKYRDITVELINKIENDQEVEVLFGQRQNIIENMAKLQFSQGDFEDLYVSLEISKLENKLQEIIKDEQRKIKEKINCLKITRNARVQYENTQFKPNFFDKKM